LYDGAQVQIPAAVSHLHGQQAVSKLLALPWRLTFEQRTTAVSLTKDLLYFSLLITSRNSQAAICASHHL
jgi:hypothetical protein